MRIKIIVQLLALLNLSHFHLEMQENFQQRGNAKQTFLEGKQIAREGLSLNETRGFFFCQCKLTNKGLGQAAEAVKKGEKY